MSKPINPELFKTFLSVLNARYGKSPYCDLHNNPTYSFHLHDELQQGDRSVDDTLLTVSPSTKWC